MEANNALPRVPFPLSYIIFHFHEVWEEGIGKDTIGIVYI